MILISKESFYLLGFCWKGQFYFYTTLPMGLSISCKVFERLATAVQWILKAKFGVKFVSHILDDFMFFWKKGSKNAKFI